MNPVDRAEIARGLASRLNLRRPLAFIDLETTGLSARTNHIVEIAMLRITPTGEMTAYSTRVNPGVPIPAEATAVHRITDQLVAERPRFGAIAPEVAAFLAGCDIAGFGIVRFDLPFLAEELRRADIEFTITDRAIVDAMAIFHDREPRDLAAAVRFYCGRELEDAHAAEADTFASFDVLAAQLDRYPDLPTDVQALDRISAPDRPDSSTFDREGRLVWQDGSLHISFGKYAGRSLHDVVTTDPGYADWMLGTDFSPEVKEAIARTRAGSPPGMGTTAGAGEGL